MSNRHIAFGVMAILTLSSCADRIDSPDGRASYDEANDPAEPTNRAIFKFNQFLDSNLLKPVAQAYADTIPGIARHSIHNFVANLHSPIILANDLLQGNFSRAAATTGRFAANSTIGLGGLFDPATDWGMPCHSADFGQTFGVWGIPPGPNVQLPLLSFSNVRDTAGTIVGFLADPLGNVKGAAASDLRLAGSVLGAVDGRAEVLAATDSLERSSIDYYAALRSVVAAKRAALVEEGKKGEVQPSSKRN